MTISDGEIISADDSIESHGNPLAQLAYEQVKSDSTNWTNTDYLGADIFTDSNGAKNTIDTGNSSALYNDSDYYELNFDGTVDETYDEFSSSPLDTDLWTTVNFDPNSSNTAFNTSDYSGYAYGRATDPNGFNGNDATQYVSLTSDTDFFGQTVETKFNWAGNSTYTGGGPNNWTCAVYWGNTVIWSYSTGSSGQDVSGNNYKIKIEPVDTNTVKVYKDEGTGSYDAGTNVDFTGDNKIGFRASAKETNDAMWAEMKIDYVKTDLRNTSDTVETNTIINEVVPDSIVVYGKTDIPTNTSITVDVSDDGGSTWSLTDKSLNTYIDTSSFTTGNLALKFNLSTTDTSTTPKLYGYSVAITDS